jgi:uncharacterized protein with FMN-binding domain
MRRFVAAFVATVAGLVILLSFKTGSVKAPPAAAFSTPTDAPESSAVASDVPASSPAESESEPAGTPAANAAAPTPSPTATGSTSAKPSSTSAKPSTTTASASKVVTGVGVTAAEGRRDVYGVVTVQLTIKNGKIVSARAVSYPQNDQHSSEISSFAIPQLNQEVLAAQGANIDAVSGATITSNAYAQSLQSALDKAKA